MSKVILGSGYFQKSKLTGKTLPLIVSGEPRVVSAEINGTIVVALSYFELAQMIQAEHAEVEVEVEEYTPWNIERVTVTIAGKVVLSRIDVLGSYEKHKNEVIHNQRREKGK